MTKNKSVPFCASGGFAGGFSVGVHAGYSVNANFTSFRKVYPSGEAPMLGSPW